MRAAALLLLGGLLLARTGGAEEAPRVPLRVGSHADHGRLVFDFPSQVPYRVEQEEGRVAIRFDAPARLDLSAARRPPRNVLGVEADGEGVVVRFAPGATVRHFRLGNRIVVDLRDAAPDAPASAPARAQAPAPPRPAPAPPRAAPAAAPAPRPPAAPAPDRAATATPAPARTERPAPSASVPEGRPVRPATTEPPSAPNDATPAPPTADEPPANAAPPPAARDALQALPAAGRPAIRALPGDATLAIRAGTEAGLAIFRRGDWIHVVIDRRLPGEATVPRGHPVFGGLEARPAGEATALRLPIAAPARLVARREGEAWILDATREEAAPEAGTLRIRAEDGPPPRLLFEGGAPGGVVTLLEPETQEVLLVGTMRAAGPAVAVGRRLPEFEVLPTMLGAAVVARSDRLALRSVAGERLALGAAAGGGLALGGFTGREPLPDALAMSRLLHLPSGSVPALLERLRVALTAVNAAAPLARGPSRRDATETLLALGMPQEAQAMAALAFQEDPLSREDPRLLLAHGIGALLAGRVQDARGIADPRLPATDEVTLWRALLGLARGEPAEPSLRAAAPLLLDYPDALRERVLPLALEALFAAGEATGAARLLDAAGEQPGLDLARAMRMEAEGLATEALAGYDALAQGRDRRQRAVALRRAAELRLARGMIDKAGAARALDQALFAWRGGPEEVALRRRIAELRREGGDALGAFAMLDEAARLFPDQAAPLREDRGTTFAAALETAPPLTAATLFDAHPDLLPAGPRGEAAVLLLADRLAALDLPDRAAALLRRAAGAAASPAARAAIGARLAGIRAAEGDAAGTLSALDATEAEGLDPGLAARRDGLRARALARRGARAEAEAIATRMGSEGAALRAELRAEAQDWAGAAAAMAEHLAATLPPAPAPLAPEQRVELARAAAYAALAGDEQALAALREAHGPRMDGGPLAEAFGVLTADPLRGVADLPRLSRELGMLRVLPTRLEALRTGVQVAR